MGASCPFLKRPAGFQSQQQRRNWGQCGKPQSTFSGVYTDRSADGRSDSPKLNLGSKLTLPDLGHMASAQEIDFSPLQNRDITSSDYDWWGANERGKKLQSKHALQWNTRGAATLGRGLDCALCALGVAGWLLEPSVGRWTMTGCGHLPQLRQNI